MTFGVLDPNAYSLTELSESPFMFLPVINPNLINVTLTCKIVIFPLISIIEYVIVKFIDTNSGLTIGSNTMQATIPNTIAIYPKDIYGNTISGLQFSLSFTATLVDGNTTITSKYN
jgi:hypothetical protein